MKFFLLHSLEGLAHEQGCATTLTAEDIILGGAAIINMLRLGPAKAFDDYANQVFLSHHSHVLCTLPLEP